MPPLHWSDPSVATRGAERRWPRLSVRALLLLVTWGCLYLACWGPTRRNAATDVRAYVADHVPTYATDGDEIGVTILVGSHKATRFEAAAPLVVSAIEYPFGRPSVSVQHYYVWLFGLVAKLPYESTTDWGVQPYARPVPPGAVMPPRAPSARPPLAVPTTRPVGRAATGPGSR